MAALALVVLLARPTCLHAQGEGQLPGDEVNVSWQYNMLQLLFEEQRMSVVRSYGGLFANPRKSLLIVGNDGMNSIALQAPELLKFVNDGGALLLMHELNGRDRANMMAMGGLGTFHRGPVLATRTKDAYEGFRDCVRITDISDRDGIFFGIESLITNRADWFVPSKQGNWDWEAVASFPTATQPVEAQPKQCLWIGRPKNKNRGMAIVLSDSTLLTNNMLWHGDNSQLALRLAELFKEQGRERFCFIRNNLTLDSITESLANKLREEQAKQPQPPLTPPGPPPKPTLSQLLNLGNVVAKEVADSNVLNEALQRQPRHISPERYFRVLIGLLIVATIVWILWKILTSPSLRELWLARRRQRHAYEIQSGNEAGDYRTAASYLAQEFCVQWTGSYYSRHWQQALATLLVRQPSVTPQTVTN